MSERRSTSCYRDARTAELVVESPVVVYPQVAQRLAGFVADAAWNQYPADPDGVRRRLADVLGAREDLVRLCSGSSESLQALTVATLLLGGSVAYPGDVFSGYTDHLDTPVRDRHSDALLDYGHGLNAPRLTAWLADDDLSRPRVCFVCCPEVPVGLGTDAVVARVETLAREHPSVHFVLDAAYVEWSLLPAVVATAARHPRVSVAATCSKLIGLAGLRLGVTVLAEMTAAEVGHGQLRFPLSSLQVAAWDALLDDLPSPSQLRLAHRDELHRALIGALAARGAQVLGAVDGLFVTIATSDELPLARLRGKALGRLGLARLRVDADNVAVLSERQVEPTGPSVAPRPRPGS